MYYPYLRGKQYELLALRELAEEGLINNKIVPIVEPIKLSPIMLSLIDIYTKAGKTIGLIQNSEYGTFYKDLENIKNYEYKEKYFSLVAASLFCLPVYILKKNIDMAEPFSLDRESVAFCEDEDIVSSIPNLAQKYNISKFMIPDERIFKREIHRNKILWSDNFKKQKRNADYANSPDNFFSDDHLYFDDEGYEGFSDFSIIGNEYTESGFAPYAVAIHMVYFDSEKKLRIHHFVSNSNDDYDDPHGKFAEALEKLIESSLIDKNTYAYNEFKRFYENRIYSGLGVVKKLSLMHHIELISTYLQEKRTNNDIL